MYSDGMCETRYLPSSRLFVTVHGTFYQITSDFIKHFFWKIIEPKSRGMDLSSSIAHEICILGFSH